LPLLYQRYIVPLDQNTAGVSELQSRQEQTEQELADLQTKLGTLETVQNEHDQSLNKLDDRIGEIETEIAARTESLETLERIQSEIQEQNEVASAELERQVDLLKSMELLSRARLFMYQSNFGLAEQDVQIARDVLATVQEDAPEALAEDLEMVLLHLDLALSNLPNFPVAASDDLDIAWQILLTGSAPTPTGAAATPTLAGTISATPNTTVTSTPRATGTVQPTVTP
jgi:predicted RNase H-like nuclease (RuvC/YqgF family)